MTHILIRSECRDNEKRVGIGKQETLFVLFGENGKMKNKIKTVIGTSICSRLFSFILEQQITNICFVLKLLPR